MDYKVCTFPLTMLLPDVVGGCNSRTLCASLVSCQKARFGFQSIPCPFLFLLSRPLLSLLSLTRAAASLEQFIRVTCPTQQDRQRQFSRDVCRLRRRLGSPWFRILTRGNGFQSVGCLQSAPLHLASATEGAEMPRLVPMPRLASVEAS